MSTIQQGIIRVREIDFRWRVLRLPTWSTSRTEGGPILLGLAILVEHPEPGHRDLVLEFDIERGRHGDMPQHQRFRIHDGRLAEAIEDAIKGGYDPDSRGKRHVHAAGKLPPK